MLTKYKTVEIKSIEKKQFNGDVYDLHVKDDHSYTVNGKIAVHNSVCETRKNTGVGVPQLGALDSIREACPDIKIIADGGIKSNGDIAKALKFADAVMIGSFISGTSETPGHVYEDKDGKFYKTYGGSASAENKVKNGGNNAFVEGVMTTVPFRGHVKHILRKTKGNLQSSFSYSGAWNLKEFHEKAEFIFITGGGKSESKI